MPIYKLTEEQTRRMHDAKGGDGVKEIVDELKINGELFMVVSKHDEELDVIYTGEDMAYMQVTDLVEGETRFEGRLA